MESQLAQPSKPPLRTRARTLIKTLWYSWATRSLALGSVATVFDLTAGTTFLMLGGPTRYAAMLGVGVGSAFTFFANRYFAFRQKDPKLASPAFRFIVLAVVSAIIHGQLVVWARDVWGIPFVFSKIAADLVVFSVGQTLLFRYVIFGKPQNETVAAVAVTASAEGTAPADT